MIKKSKSKFYMVWNPVSILGEPEFCMTKRKAMARAREREKESGVFAHAAECQLVKFVHKSSLVTKNK